MRPDTRRPGETPRLRTIVLLGVVLLFALAISIAVGPSSAAADDQPANVTVYAESDSVLTDADAVEAVVTNGTLDRADRAAAGETLVVAIESDRLAEDLAARNGTTTERFFDVVDGDARFLLAQTNPTPERPRKVVRPGPRNTTVYRTNNTTYALLETSEFDYRWGSLDGNRTTELWDGERFAVAFGYGVDNPDGPEVTLFTTPAEIGVPDPLAPERFNRTVDVNIQPEESLFVRATFGSNRTVTVPAEPVEGSEDRRVSLDVSDVDPGTTYALELVHDGAAVDRDNGTVVEPRATVRNVSVAFVENRTVVNATVTVTHTGELQVLNGTGVELGSTWVDSTVRSNATNVTVRLHDGGADTLRVRAVRAREDRPYPPYPGSEASVTVDVSDREIRGTSPPSVTRTTTPTPTPTVTSSPPSPVTPTETLTRTPATETPTERLEANGTKTATSTAGGSGPGFGPVVALGATLTLLVCLRHRVSDSNE